MPRKAATAPVETQEAQIEVGSFVRFLGYDDETPESDRVLEADAVYEVKEVNEDDNGDITYAVEAQNPDFDSKKRASKTNVEFVLVDVFPEEVELSDEEEGDEKEDAKEEQAPAPAKGKGKTTAKAAAKEEPAQAAKGKTTAKGKAKEEPATAKGKATATKGKAPAKAKEAAPAPEGDGDDLPTLESEDAEIVALVEGADDLIELAQELAGDVAATEYRLGGVLYHVKKEGEYKALDERYAEKGGFDLFLLEKMNLEYRKAMYLIDIYIGFNQAGIENPGEVVAQIGWTKASKIAKLMTADNADDLIELAESNTVADLQTTIKEQYVGGDGSAPATPRHKRLTMKFRFLEDDGKDAIAILTEAKEIAGVKDDSDALLFILREWQLNAGGGENAEVSKEAAPNVKGKGAAKAGSTRRATAKA